ncbi:CBS domain-containing protein [Nocardia wallacei]|uniref:CBS domain-containing protein n=1 Tax=Nocardia wallacei TaxID=480035 RepID=UPI002455FE4F|nr:CBS domain-containing protein [Nocardia wallacei]
MKVPAEVVHPDSEVSAVATRMLTHHLRSMPVVEAGILVGIVARRDLLRALACDDDVLETKIRALLDIYAGSRRQWAIEVADGRALVRGGFADAAEQRTVSALALTVDGVVHVDIAADRPLPANPRSVQTATPSPGKSTVRRTTGAPASGALENR